MPALDLFNLFANIAASPKFQNMMTKVFLVLILGFGPYSHVDGLGKSLMLIIQANFPSLERVTIFGLAPNNPSKINIDEQTAPIFAGAMHNFYSRSGDSSLHWLRQKEKPAGSVSWRIGTVPVVSEGKYPHNSLAITTPQSAPHASRKKCSF